jgi:hypothetical protein
MVIKYLGLIIIITTFLGFFNNFFLEHQPILFQLLSLFMHVDIVHLINSLRGLYSIYLTENVFGNVRTRIKLITTVIITNFMIHNILCAWLIPQFYIQTIGFSGVLLSLEIIMVFKIYNRENIRTKILSILFRVAFSHIANRQLSILTHIVGFLIGFYYGHL